MPVKPNDLIVQLSPYAKSETRIPGFDKPITLSQNELGLPPSPAALRAIQHHDDLDSAFMRYSDPAHEILKTALAETFDLDASQLMCGAGSMELMLLLSLSYLGPGDEVVETEFGYKYFSTLASMMGAIVVQAPTQDMTADVDAMLACVTDRTKAVYLANPNNPTGTCLSGEDLERLVNGVRDNVLVIIDAAYGEFVTDPTFQTGAAFVAKRDNVVVLRTFSKIYGLAGLRVGWGYTSQTVINILERMRPANSVSAVGLAAATAATRDYEHLRATRDHVSREKEALYERLKNLGLDFVPSQASFVLIRVPEDWPMSAGDLFEAIKRHGIILRPVASFGLPNYLRVSIGSPEEMKALHTALAEIVG